MYNIYSYALNTYIYLIRFDYSARPYIKKTRGRTPYVRRSKWSRPPSQDIPPQPIDDNYLEISYSPISEQSQPIDLLSPSVIPRYSGDS